MFSSSSSSIQPNNSLDSSSREKKEDDEEVYHEELLLLVFGLAALEMQVFEMENTINILLTEHLREQRRLNRSLPLSRVRPTWANFASKLSERHFKRMFRMSLPAFTLLCRSIEKKIGHDKFRPEKPEEVISDISDTDFTPEESIKSKIPIICGKIKVAIGLRMLAGGSYLDLVPLFDVSTSHIYNMLHKFVDWVLFCFEFPLARWLHEEHWDALEVRANHFAEKSNGVFYGTFGAIDGLAIRICSPKLSEVPDPGNYYCRKGFYALNVQAICDKSKRFLTHGDCEFTIPFRKAF